MFYYVCRAIIISLFGLYFPNLINVPLFDEVSPEWQHRQCVGLVFRRSHDPGSLSAASLVICGQARIAVCNTWSSGGTALSRVGGAISQLDLPSLTPLSVAGCG